MARKKQEEASGGAPAWMATFSDLMNLLLCFFVLLFSMSSVDQAKFDALIASLQSQYSILTGGGASIGDGKMISAGLNQLRQFDIYFNPKASSNGEGKSDAKEQDLIKDMAENDGQNHDPEKGFSDQNQGGSGLEKPERTDTPAEFPTSKPAGNQADTSTDTQADVTAEEAVKIAQEAALLESEQMAGQMEKLLQRYGIQNTVNVDFNGQSVILTLNGAILFASGSSDLVQEAHPLVEKIGMILKKYRGHTIEIEGHTDNVPVHNERFADNNVLSMYRALSVADYLRSVTNLNPASIKSSGRGDYMPIADNATAEGRAQNRRVEIKVYNSYNSDKL